MADITATVDVDVPVRVAYNQWTQFEEFPRFMEGVEEVRQLDDATLQWRANIGGVERSWEARITEQEPDQVVAWQSTSGTQNSGRVVFQPLDEGHTRIDLTMEHEPEGAMENIGQALGIIEQRAEGDLERFKEFIEDLGSETGAWRGEIHGSQVEGEPLDSGLEVPIDRAADRGHQMDRGLEDDPIVPSGLDQGTDDDPTMPYSGLDAGSDDSVATRTSGLRGSMNQGPAEQLLDDDELRDSSPDQGLNRL